MRLCLNHHRQNGVMVSVYGFDLLTARSGWPVEITDQILANLLRLNIATKPMEVLTKTLGNVLTLSLSMES